MKRGRGNPNWVEGGWGEETRTYRLPVRIGERIQQLRKEGNHVEDILILLNIKKFDFRPYFNEYLYQIERGTIKLPLMLKETAKRVLYAFLDYWNNPPS